MGTVATITGELYERHGSFIFNYSLREKCPKTEFFSGTYFPTFVLNTEIYRVNLRIQSECGKMQTRKNSVL